MDYEQCLFNRRKGGHIKKRNSNTEEVVSLTSDLLRITVRQNFLLQDWFRNKLGVGLG